MPEEIPVSEQDITQVAPPKEFPFKERGFVRTEEALGFIKTLDTSRPDYFLDDAITEKPLTHYTHGGNLLQILRFGLQSNNFKNRLSEHRAADPNLDAVAKEMSGFRFKQGASYQGKDSISMSVWSENAHTGPRNVLLLVNPDTQIWGLGEQRETTGYGHGIKVREIILKNFSSSQ